MFNISSLFQCLHFLRFFFLIVLDWLFFSISCFINYLNYECGYVLFKYLKMMLQFSGSVKIQRVGVGRKIESRVVIVLSIYWLLIFIFIFLVSMCQ